MSEQYFDERTKTEEPLRLEHELMFQTAIDALDQARPVGSLPNASSFTLTAVEAKVGSQRRGYGPSVTLDLVSPGTVTIGGSDSGRTVEVAQDRFLLFRDEVREGRAGAINQCALKVVEVGDETAWLEINLQESVSQQGAAQRRLELSLWRTFGGQAAVRQRVLGQQTFVSGEIVAITPPTSDCTRWRPGYSRWQGMGSQQIDSRSRWGDELTELFSPTIPIRALDAEEWIGLLSRPLVGDDVLPPVFQPYITGLLESVPEKGRWGGIMTAQDVLDLTQFGVEEAAPFGFDVDAGSFTLTEVSAKLHRQDGVRMRHNLDLKSGGWVSDIRIGRSRTTPEEAWGLYQQYLPVVAGFSGEGHLEHWRSRATKLICMGEEIARVEVLIDHTRTPATEYRQGQITFYRTLPDGRCVVQELTARSVSRHDGPRQSLTNRAYVAQHQDDPEAVALTNELSDELEAQLASFMPFDALDAETWWELLRRPLYLEDVPQARRS